MIINNKSDLCILKELLIDKRVNNLQSITITALRDKLEEKGTKFSVNKVRNTLYDFVEKNIVEKGLKSGRADTFYISKLGIETLNNMVNGGMKNE